MPQPIIAIHDLKRTFRVPVKTGEGLLASFRYLLKGDYNEVTAVDGLTMEVGAGEIRGLVGPNGAGKSTTIKIISGVLYPTAGTADVMGFTPWLQRKDYVRHIGVLFGQKSQLFWDLPPIDTFLLHKEMYGIPERRFRQNIDYFNDLLQIDDVVKRPVRNLSLGERMKCELVCAMLHEPEVVYLDEPTIGLDLFAKESIRNYIKRVRAERGVTFILTTHDLNEIEALCDKVAVINYGTVVYDGTIPALASFVSKKRVIEVRLSRETAISSLPGVTVLSATPMSLKLEVDLSTTAIRDVIYNLCDLLPVHDIAIKDTPIEDVIRQVYFR